MNLWVHTCNIFQVFFCLSTYSLAERTASLSGLFQPDLNRSATSRARPVETMPSKPAGTFEDGWAVFKVFAIGAVVVPSDAGETYGLGSPYYCNDAIAIAGR